MRADHLDRATGGEGLVPLAGGSDMLRWRPLQAIWGGPQKVPAAPFVHHDEAPAGITGDPRVLLLIDMVPHRITRTRQAREQAGRPRQREPAPGVGAFPERHAPGERDGRPPLVPDPGGGETRVQVDHSSPSGPTSVSDSPTGSPTSGMSSCQTACPSQKSSSVGSLDTAAPSPSWPCGAVIAVIAVRGPPSAPPQRKPAPNPPASPGNRDRACHAMIADRDAALAPPCATPDSIPEPRSRCAPPPRVAAAALWWEGGGSGRGDPG